jgi:hypothetical protein
MERAQHGAGASGEDGNVPGSGEIAHEPGVSLRLRERHVPGDGGDAENLELLLRGKREENGNGVVLSRIAVEDDRSHGNA